MSQGVVRPRERDDLAVVGTGRPRVDVWDKVTGRAAYAGDLTRPGMLVAALKRSTQAHARIVSVETGAAEAMDGVLAVITGADLPTRFGVLPFAQDETAMAVEKVRYVGEPVAAVAATDEATARAATERIEVTYEPLDAVTSIEGALGATGEPVHGEAGEGNADRVASLEFGDVEAALASAAHVREDVYFYEGNSHVPLEPHSAVAEWDRGRGTLTLWASTQMPHTVHRVLASVFDLPERRVRVHANTVGGGFGGKLDPFPHQVCAVALSRRTGRPVKVTLTREEVFYAHRGRHPVLMWIRTGVDEAGRIVGMDFESYLDGGAYSSFGPATTYYTGALQGLTYRIPNYRFGAVRVNTNKPPCGPKRGHGAPQPRYAEELHLTRLAEDLGMDPVEFRRLNLTGPDEVTMNWLEITSNGLEACIDAVLEASGWAEKRGRLPEGEGVGFALSSFYTGAGEPTYWNDMPHSEVQVKVDRSGKVTAYSGAAEIGQGSDDVLATVVAEVFGLAPEEVGLVVGDTDETPVDLGAYSSRVTLMMGNAAKQAAERAREPVVEAAASELSVSPDDLRFRDGRVYPAGEPEAGMAFPEAVALAEARSGPIGAMGGYMPPEKLGDHKGAGVGPSPCYSFSATVVEVRVDPETGRVDPDRVWMAHDVGRPINRTSVEGQVDGSIYMGLGEVLMEAQVFDAGGRHAGPSLLDYKVPTPGEMPAIESILVETDEPRGPYGAKEAGQGPLLPIPPAVADAVYDAVGARVRETPITPRKVLAALAGRDVGPDGVPDFDFPSPIQVDVPEGLERGD